MTYTNEQMRVFGSQVKKGYRYSELLKKDVFDYNKFMVLQGVFKEIKNYPPTLIRSKIPEFKALDDKLSAYFNRKQRTKSTKELGNLGIKAKDINEEKNTINQTPEKQPKNRPKAEEVQKTP